MEAMLTIVSKVAVMLIMIVVGYYIAKKGIFTERGTSEINNPAAADRHPLPHHQLLQHHLGGTDLQPMELLMAVEHRPLAALFEPWPEL